MTKHYLTEDDYKNKFAEKPDSNEAGPSEIAASKEAETRAGRALHYASDIRKFEIELYWKRATYFWGFIAAAFAGYALTYKNGAEHEPWLTLIFSAVGLIFSFSWYLVNRGSKFWQQNWERHVDLLEDMTLGPLYKIVAEPFNKNRNFLTAPGQFSVSKINQMLSVFVSLIWFILYIKALCPISPSLPPDYFKIAVTLSTSIFIIFLWHFGKSGTGVSTSKLELRRYEITTPPSVNMSEAPTS